MKFRAEIECMNNMDIPDGKLIVESNGTAGEGSNFVYLTIGDIKMELRSVEVIEAVTRLTGKMKI